jgi:indolepyruvate ferredoxin oxidoreductase
MLVDALREMGLLGQFPILKLGLSYPMDMTLVERLAGMVDRIVVVEERRSFIEKQVAEQISRVRQNAPDSPLAKVELWGKEFPRGVVGIPATRGLHPSILIERLTAFLRDTPGLPAELSNGRLTEELDTIAQSARQQVPIPVRTPAYCPGCPHRDSSSALLEIRKCLLDAEYMRVNYGRGPVDLVAHGDTGCYTMMMFEPNKPLMHNYSGMGLGGGTGAGVDPFITNKQIVFMGDGTFFHSGQLAIGNSITSGQDITYIILENSTTAMTGHQPNPTLDEDIMGNRILAHDIERIVKSLIPEAAGGLGVGPGSGGGKRHGLEGRTPRARVIRMSPAERDNYKQVLEEVILEDGVKVVIADKECGITFHRRKKREEIAEKKEKGFLGRKTYMNVTEEVCENCLECTNQTGCPALKVVATDYGSKIQTDFTTCVNDGACSHIDACPSFEQVIVTRTRPPRLPDEVVDLTGIPEPPLVDGGKLKDTWRCYLAGVGGMGIGVAGEILTRAGHKEGYHIGFIDKKGLAIRNGGVFCQLQFSREPIVGSPQTPWGKADLLIGIDAVEAARAVSPDQPLRVASPKFTRAVVNTGKTGTVLSLMGRDDFDPEELAHLIESQCKPGQFFSFNVGDLCERLLDSKLYANIMMLGVAYQLGFIPVSYKSIQWAIKHAVGREFERNYRAFNIGRKIVLRPDLFGVALPNQVETMEQALERKATILTFSSIWGKKNAVAYKALCQQTLEQMPGLDEALRRDYVIRVYDAVQWGTLSYAETYARRVVQAYRRDESSRRYALTRAVIWNLAKVMMIKDEVYVAMLYTSPEKYKRDRRRFNVNPANGDKIQYLHLNRPEFVIGGRTWRFAIKGRDWQMRIIRHCRWLRNLMPKWHGQEKAYRGWYEELVDACLAERGQGGATVESWRYGLWLEILRAPEPVTGFREVRYPKMDASRRKVAEWQRQLQNGPAAPEARPREVSLSGMLLSR